MNSRFFKPFFLLLIIPFLCSAGYVGTLPDLHKNLEFKPDKNIINEIDAKDILPLDENDLPTNYTQSLIKKSQYSQYLSDIDEIIQLIEKLKDTIKNQKSVQNFNSVANVINIYIKSFEQKYEDGNEKHFESYKLLVNLNDNIQMTGEYWVSSNHNVKYVSNYQTAGFYSDSAVSEKLEKLLNIIDDTLTVLKESSL